MHSHIVLLRSTKPSIHLRIEEYDSCKRDLYNQLCLLSSKYTIFELMTLVEHLDIEYVHISPQTFNVRNFAGFVEGGYTFPSDDCIEINHEYIVDFHKGYIEIQEFSSNIQDTSIQ